MPRRYQKRLLDEGLCVIGVENPALHSFACDVRVHAGPRFERREEAGLTHFLEHMIVQGSERFPTSQAITAGIEDMGGAIDASSHPESLEVYLGMHRKHWTRGLDILTDVLLHPLFDAEEIEHEKLIVAEEIAEYRDERERNISAAELAYSLMFKEQIDELGTRGSVSSLRGFDRALVCSQYARFFNLNNMVVSVAGGIDFPQVCDMLEESLGQLPAGGELPRVLRTEVERPRARVALRWTEKMPVVEVELSYRAYGLGDKRFGAAAAVSHVLGGGLSSRLFSRVREELGLVYNIWGFPVAYSDTGSVHVAFSVESANLAQALQAVLEVIGQMGWRGVTPEELERYKENVRCGMDILCDQPHRLADWLSNQELLLRPERLMTPEEFVSQQEALSTADLGDAIKDVFAPDKANLAVVGPFGAAAKEEIIRLFPAEQCIADVGP